MSSAAPILVTGMVRSGTTWVGKMLAAGGGTTYLSEPLNVWEPGILRLPAPHRYTYIHPGNEAEFLPIFRDTVRLRPRLLSELRAARAPVDVGRIGLRAARFGWGRMRRNRILLKDPYAVFSAQWFADRLGFRVVVVLRNPGAVVSSLKRLNWRAPLMDLLAQPALMRDWLEPYRGDLESAREKADLRRDLIWSNATLWRMIHSAVDAYAARRPDFVIVRHEDLSRDPQGGFSRLYEALEMRFDQRATAAVEAASKPGNPAEPPTDRPHSVRVDSRAGLGTWRGRLSKAEIEKVHMLTEPVASRWYGDGWE